MLPDKFIQSTSISRRLRTVMFSIAIFFVIGFFANYVSSLGFLRGLQEINHTNIILNQIAQSVEALDSSNKSVDNIKSSENLADTQFMFQESQKILQKTLKDAQKHSENKTEVFSMLLDAESAVREFEESAKNLFLNYKAFDPEQLQSELLVINQFSLEARDAMRKTQIHLRQSSNNLFDSIYKTRFVPLIVTIVLSIFFFIFVVTYGLSLAKKIESSLMNLTDATNKVANGNLSYQAKILDADEVGNLTHAFNTMVQTLNSGRHELDKTVERIRSLQQITAAFSEALTADQVCEVTVKIGIDALGATGGAVGILTKDGLEIELRKIEGYSKESMAKWMRFPVTTVSPLAETIRFQQAHFFEDLGELKRFPTHYAELIDRGMKAMVTLPLIVGSSCMGGVSFSFSASKVFNANDRDFLIAIARQAAQALHRSQLYDNAREAIESRDEFLSIASHELKTPLTPLKLQLQMLSRQIKKGKISLSPEKINLIVENSDRQLGRLSKLIEDLLDVSRITSGKLTLNLERFHLDQMIHEVLTQYGHQLKDALKKVEVSIQSNVEGEFDKVRLEQVLINLLTNAAKYAPGKPIKVSLVTKDSFATISISDQGPGIPMEHQSRIFDRFERVKENDNVGGLGLGLFISQQIIHAHNGEIHVESQPGQGATFIVNIPLQQALQSG